MYMSGTHKIIVYREKLENHVGYRHTYHVTTNMGVNRETEAAVARAFNFQPGQLYNAVERWWQPYADSIWELDITVRVKQHAAAERAAALNKTRRPRSPNLTTAERAAKTRKRNKANARRHILALRAVGAAPDPFKPSPRNAQESADQT